MKKFIYFFMMIVYPIVSSSFLTSCTSLDENPKTFISSNQYYRNVSDAEAALTAVYWGLNNSSDQTPYNVLFETGMEFMTDDDKMGPGATNPDVKSLSMLTHSSSNLRVRQIWQQHYSAIVKADIAIDKIPTIQVSDSASKKLLKRYVAEAKFLRGLYYFNLVRLFGSVPLVLHETTNLNNSSVDLPRVSADKIYAQIIQDFTDASQILDWYYPSTSVDAGRANAAAAEAFLQLVYLTLANVSLDDNQRASNISVISNRSDYLKKSIAYGDDIVNHSNRYYDLFPDYADVFKKASKNGIEHLFSAQFSSTTLQNGNGQGQRITALGIKGANGNFASEPTSDLINKFRKTDNRWKAFMTNSYTIAGVTTVIDPVQNDGCRYACTKYFDSDVPTMLAQSGINVPIIRYAEVLLNRAEANNELYGPNGDAYQDYNLIRKRAGLPLFAAGSLSKDQFRDSLYLDRRLELNFEYQRWFDLIREIDKDGNHIMVKTLHDFGKPSAEDKHYLFPIPQNEIDLDPALKQNPGWN